MTPQRMKRQKTEFEKMFVMHITGKRLVSKICKELIPISEKNWQDT